MITLLPFIKKPITTQKSEFKPYTTTPIRLHNQPFADSVDFKGNFRFLELYGVPCAYCGKTMIPSTVQKDFGQFTTDAKGIVLQKGLYQALGGRTLTLEKSISELFSVASKKLPEKDLQGLASALAPASERRLIRIQAHVLRKAAQSLKMLKGETKDLSASYFAHAREKLSMGNDDVGFKRKNIINAFMALYETEKDKTNLAPLGRVLKCLSKLPTSGNNKDAFIVKYQRRTSREIGERLLDPYIASKEHIHPESDRGASSARNYLGTHRKCNSERGDMPFDKFLAQKPQIVKFIFENLSEINNRIKNNNVFDPNNYLFNVSRTLYIESKGVIRLPFLKDVPMPPKKKK